MKILLINCLISSYLFAGVLGTFPRISKVNEDHVLKTYTVKEIEDFILYTSNDGHKCNDHYRLDYSSVDNRSSSNIVSSLDLAKQIHKTALIMGIDAGIMSALIYKESQFCTCNR